MAFSHRDPSREEIASYEYYIVCNQIYHNKDLYNILNQLTYLHSLKIPSLEEYKNLGTPYFVKYKKLIFLSKQTYEYL